MFYKNKPIEKTEPIYCENPSKEIKNLLLGLPIHAIDSQEVLPEDEVTFKRNFGTDRTELTDGLYSPDNNFENPQWFRVNRGLGRVITFKLPYICAVSGFKVNFCRDDHVAVRTPTFFNIRVSVDGENFMTVSENLNTRSFRDLHNHTVKGNFDTTAALYVQFNFDVVNHVFIDEIELYGCTDASDAKVPVADNKPLFYERPEPEIINEYPPEDLLGAKNISLAYCYNTFQESRGLLKEDYFLPLVAYLDRDGKILDTFMDAILFLPHTSFNFSERGQCAAGWKEYMDIVFHEEYNLAELKKAVKKTKDALNMPDYKVGLFFSIPYTYTNYKEFGVLEDEKLVFDNVESRKTAIKWMIDTYIARHEASGTEHTEIKGFYWFEEVINPADYYEEELIAYAGDYARSMGYHFFWIPYYKAQGYQDWKRMKFDTACMQPNYAFEDHIPKERLYESAELCKKLGMCVEIEADVIELDAEGKVTKPLNVEKFKEYLEVGAETGYMNSIKMYYHCSAPGSVVKAWNSKEDYYRELYDMTYLFSRNKLVPRDKK